MKHRPDPDDSLRLEATRKLQQSTFPDEELHDAKLAELLRSLNTWAQTPKNPKARAKGAAALLEIAEVVEALDSIWRPAQRRHTPWRAFIDVNKRLGHLDLVAQVSGFVGASIEQLKKTLASGEPIWLSHDDSVRFKQLLEADKKNELVDTIAQLDASRFLKYCSPPLADLYSRAGRERGDLDLRISAIAMFYEFLRRWPKHGVVVYVGFELLQEFIHRVKYRKFIARLEKAVPAVALSLAEIRTQERRERDRQRK